MMLNKWDYNDTLINEKIKDEIIIAGFYRFVKNFFQKDKKYNSSPGRKTSGTKYFSHSPLHPGGNNHCGIVKAPELFLELYRIL